MGVGDAVGDGSGGAVADGLGGWVGVGLVAEGGRWVDGDEGVVCLVWQAEIKSAAQVI